MQKSSLTRALLTYPVYRFLIASGLQICCLQITYLLPNNYFINIVTE